MSMSGSVSIYDVSTLQRAVHYLRQGGVLAYPTESVWGLGCNPFDEQAVQQLLDIKKRDMDKGVILIAGCIRQIQSYIEHLSVFTQDLIIESWQTQNDNQNADENNQQAITWLIPLTVSNEKGVTQRISVDVPKFIVGDHDSIAIRVTPHPEIQKLCAMYGGVIVSTSCNPAGKSPATDLASACEYFGDDVHYYSAVTLGYSAPSRIIDALTLKVIRE